MAEVNQYTEYLLVIIKYSLGIEEKFSFIFLNIVVSKIIIVYQKCESLRQI